MNINTQDLTEWKIEDLPVEILKAGEGSDMADVLNTLELLEFSLKEVIIDEASVKRYCKEIVQFSIDSGSFYDGSGQSFYEIFDNIKKIVEQNPESDIDCVDAAGQARSVNLAHIITTEYPKRPAAQAFGTYNTQEIIVDIENFLEKGKRSVYFVLYYEKFNEPFTLITSIVIDIFFNGKRKGLNPRYALLYETIEKNMPQILRGDLSSLGIDTFIIKKEQ